MATQQNSELDLQLEAVQQELQETKQRQGFLSFHVWLCFRIRTLCAFLVTDTKCISNLKIVAFTCTCMCVSTRPDSIML
jgi:hypothetical protein